MTNISYIRAGWLLDGTGGPVRSKMLLRVTDGYIDSIEPYSETLGIDDKRIIDLSHCTILPPLVDSHVHLFMSGTLDMAMRENQLVAGYDALRPVIEQHINDLFSHGVLAVRDGGDRGGFAIRFKQEKSMGGLSVELKVAGRAYHVIGRYGGLIGRHTQEDGVADDYKSDTEDKDFVKIVNSGLNSLKIYGRQTQPQYSLEALAEIVKLAEEKGQKVMVHANGREPVKRAIEAGCHSIEHGFFMGDENLLRMANKGTRWIPTVFTMQAYGNNLPFGGDGADHSVLERNVQHQLEQLQVAKKLGVEVVLGTDAGSLGVFHGPSMVEEMELFRQAGYSLPEIICSATQKGAQLLGIESYGALLPGKRATFLAVRAEPSQLPRQLLHLEKIYVDGIVRQ